ncbi:MAG: UDP-N-acetylglucosamine 1-carboxyvinyltransferase [Candidatus Dormibacteraceae bacterium]
MPRDQVLLIEGGRELVGRICISGSKNASLPIMAACLLTKAPVRLENVPDVADTQVMGEILSSLGCRLRTHPAGGLEVSAVEITEPDVPDELGRRMRASVVLLGALLARTGRARLPRPGGDEIGLRRVEQHIRGLRQMGARVVESDGYFSATAARLHGARIILDLPTVTGTENLMMAAVLAEGRTEILNAAREPHVQDLAVFLAKLGARVYGAGTDELVVEGVERLGGCDHRVIPDYLEAGTYAMAVAAAGGEAVLECSPPQDLTTVLLKLQLAGAEVEAGMDSIRVRRSRRRRLQPVDLTTWVHPGFPTDLQAQYLAMMTQAHGESVISEYIFENRFQHVPELMRMGARISVDGRTATVHGPSLLHGTDAVIPDIRSGAALVIAALCARGTTELHQAWHVDRGYHDLVGKLTALGARVRPARARARRGRPGSGTYE